MSIQICRRQLAISWETAGGVGAVGRMAHIKVLSQQHLDLIGKE